MSEESTSLFINGPWDGQTRIVGVAPIVRVAQGTGETADLVEFVHEGDYVRDAADPNLFRWSPTEPPS